MQYDGRKVASAKGGGEGEAQLCFEIVMQLQRRIAPRGEIECDHYCARCNWTHMGERNGSNNSWNRMTLARKRIRCHIVAYVGLHTRHESCVPCTYAFMHLISVSNNCLDHTSGKA